MQQRKNSKNNRNYLIKCTCPNCINQSEHSYTRVQKGSALMCPHCSKIFTQDKLPLFGRDIARRHQATPIHSRHMQQGIWRNL